MLRTKFLIYLIFLLLACSSAFALTITDLKPDDRVRDVHILTSYRFYKEESTSTILPQPFFSYEDLDAHIFIYDSPRVNASKGYDLMVIFEDWKSETTAKNRFERDFKLEAGFQECSMSFSRRVKKCEKQDYPQITYVSHYQNFLIRIQPHPDYPFTNEELFYLSFDMQKLIENIISKISKLEEDVTEEDIIPIKQEIIPAEKETQEEKPTSEEAKQGFFSRNKYYILGGIIIFLIILWMYKTKNLLKNMFIIILGLIILNGYTVLTKKETIILAFLWTIIYFLIRRFYIKQIKKKRRRKQ